MHTIADGARQLGFKGGVVVDYPNSAKGKKFFLVVQAPGKRLVTTSDTKQNCLFLSLYLVCVDLQPCCAGGCGCGWSGWGVVVVWYGVVVV